MSSIPQLLDYQSVKPRGIATEFKSMRFTPLTSFNSYVTNDIVRFWIPMIQGFWDPYQSYIEIEVEVNETDFPYGTGIQVDNSASSFISEMTIFADSSKEVERIQQYDTVAALLHDVMYTPGDQFGKEYQGTGYASHTSQGLCTDTRQQTSTANSTSVSTNLNGANWDGATATPGSIDPLGYYTYGYLPGYPAYIDGGLARYGVYAPIKAGLSGGAALIDGHLKGYIPSPITNVQYAVGQAQNANSQHIKSNPPGVRYQLTTRPLNLTPSYENNNSAPYILPPDLNMLAPRPYVQAVYQSACFGLQGTNAHNFTLYPIGSYTAPGSTGLNPAFTQLSNGYIQPNYDTAPVTTGGYTQAYSEQLSNGSNEPLFAPAHGQTWIHNGAFQTKPQAITQRIFQIPIISSLLGVLIPAESYKLIPMEALQNLMIQFRLNEYAMFTSGYKEDFVSGAGKPNRSKIPMSAYAQLQRAWQINKIQIWGAIYQFDDFVTSMVKQKLASGGITISSNGWSLGPRFSLATTSLLQNSWQINAGYQSLQTLIFRIQSDDYQRYTFCRKHYYLSGNVSSLQLKISNTYIPPQPIEGHAGNILPYANQQNNAPFIIELHKTFGQLFNVGANMYINSSNFAVNDRPYDPTNTAAYTTNLGSLTCTIDNIDTTGSLPLFHENRCVGRATYAFDLEALPGQPNVISGLNTLEYRPFEVMIDVDTVSSSYTRDSTLVFLLNYDVIYVLHDGVAPDIYGRG